MKSAVHHSEIITHRAGEPYGITVLAVTIIEVSGTVADPKSIFVAALKGNACAVILAHNHPSGNLNPSQADINLTKDMVAAGKFLHIPVLDHIIITSETYYSFADEGLL